RRTYARAAAESAREARSPPPLRRRRSRQRPRAHRVAARAARGTARAGKPERGHLRARRIRAAPDDSALAAAADHRRPGGGPEPAVRARLHGLPQALVSAGVASQPAGPAIHRALGEGRAPRRAPHFAAAAGADPSASKLKVKRGAFDVKACLSFFTPACVLRGRAP